MDAYVQRCLRQFQQHATNLEANGDKLIAIPHTGLYDLFVGQGWTERIRFRLVHLKQDNTHQIVQLSGPALSKDYRRYLLKELVK